MRRFSSPKSWATHLKLLTKKAVRYGMVMMVLTVVVAGGIMTNEQSIVQKQELEEKKKLLEQDNKSLVREIKNLEREVTLLRSDPNTIEKTAKRKLGMARKNETIYIFDRTSSEGVRFGN